MKIPLKKTFTKEIDNKISDEEILNSFIINLKIKSLNTFNKIALSSESFSKLTYFLLNRL